MKRFVVAVILALFLGGCAGHFGTKEPRGFYKVSKLSELQGVYKNHGDWEGSGTLAYMIWQGRSNKPPVFKYKEVEFIEVLSLENSLTVRAIQSGCSVYEQTYVLGKDFKIEDGKIAIYREFHFLSRGGGDLMLGPSYFEETLGIDTGKDAKYKSSESVAGLALLFIPIAGTETRDVRFERLSDKPLGYPDCLNGLGHK